MDGSLKSSAYPALLLIEVLAAFATFGARTDGQFLSREHPVSADEIKIGMSAPETGRAGAIGMEIRHGCEAYFTKVNRDGGVAGRRLTLVDYDDRYEPVETVSNVECLIDRDKVFALLGFYGTSTCRAILPMVNDANIVMVGPISGSPSLLQPMQRLIFNMYATYAGEAESLVEGYMSSLALVAGLRGAGAVLTEDSLVAALEHLSIDVKFSQESRQGNDQVFLTQVDHGRALPVEKLVLPQSGK